MYDEVQNQFGSRKDIAKCAFHWVSCSGEPLSPTMLVAAVCQDLDSDESDPIDVDINFVLSACRNLLTLRDYKGDWVNPGEEDFALCRFSHLSIQEYFENRWTLAQMHALVALAKVCLKILNDPNHWNLKREELPLDMRKILEYAANYWHIHLQNCNGIIDTRLVTLLKRFLGSINESSAAYKSTYTERWNFALEPFSRSCHAITAFGLHHFLPDWLELGFDDLDEENHNGYILLATALRYRQRSTAMLLIERGASANHPQVLNAAAFSGDREVVEL